MNSKIYPSVFTEIRFATPAIEELANALRLWFNSAIPGGLIYGPSRAGKSNAIEYITQRREEIFGYNVPIVSVLWKKTVIKEKDFHERFLAACGHSIPSDRVTNRFIERRLVEYLASMVAASGGSSLIVFIDEAQDMRLDDLAYLANVYNKLKSKKIQQYTFLVGERKVTELRTKAAAAGAERYIGRFMCADYNFPLLRSAEDLKFVLSQFDTCDFPEGSGTTVVEKFVPLAFKSGWRFSTQAPAVWSGFRSASRAIGKSGRGMTMQACATLVALILQALGARDSSTLVLLDEDVERAAELVRHLHIA